MPDSDWDNYTDTSSWVLNSRGVLRASGTPCWILPLSWGDNGDLPLPFTSSLSGCYSTSLARGDLAWTHQHLLNGNFSGPGCIIWQCTLDSVREQRPRPLSKVCLPSTPFKSYKLSMGWGCLWGFHTSKVWSCPASAKLFAGCCCSSCTWHYVRIWCQWVVGGQDRWSVSSFCLWVYCSKGGHVWEATCWNLGYRVSTSLPKSKCYTEEMIGLCGFFPPLLQSVVIGFCVRF